MRTSEIIMLISPLRNVSSARSPEGTGTVEPYLRAGWNEADVRD